MAQSNLKNLPSFNAGKCILCEKTDSLEVGEIHIRQNDQVNGIAQLFDNRYGYKYCQDHSYLNSGLTIPEYVGILQGYARVELGLQKPGPEADKEA